VGSIKVERVREKVKTEVARIIQTELNDPRLGFVTITKVDITPDFREAKIYFSVLGTDKDLRRVTRMLEDAKGFIQKGVASRLRTRVTPILRFAHDKSIEKSIRVAEILQQIRDEKGPELERSEDLEDSNAVAADPADAQVSKADPRKKKPAARHDDDEDEDEEDDEDEDDEEDEDEDEDE
jgi:ribosome-binding factor A